MQQLRDIRVNKTVSFSLLSYYHYFQTVKFKLIHVSLYYVYVCMCLHEFVVHVLMCTCFSYCTALITQEDIQSSLHSSQQITLTSLPTATPSPILCLSHTVFPFFTTT